MEFTVLRAFLLAGIRQEVGSEIDLADRELIGTLKSAGKIAPTVKGAAGDKPAPSGPMTTRRAGGLVGARKGDTA
jgi:hypothetical protein